MISSAQFRSIVWLVFERSQNIILSLIFFWFLADILNIEQFANYIYLLTICSLVYTAVGPSIDSFVIEKLIRKEVKLSSFIAYRIVLLSLLMGTVLLALVFFEPKYLHDFIVVAPILGFTIFGVYENLQVAKENFVHIAKAKQVITYASFFVKLTVLFYFADEIYILGLTLIEYVTLNIYLFFLHMRDPDTDIIVNNSQVSRRDIYLRVQPLVLITIFHFIFKRVDIFIVEAMFDKNILANYGFAQRLAELPQTLAIIISNVLYPKLLRLDAAERLNRFAYYLKLVFSLGFFIFIFLALGFYILAPEILNAKYSEAQYIGIWYCMAGVVLFSNSIMWRWDTINGNESVAFVKTVIGLMLNIVLSVYFVGFLGWQGPAVATVISYFICYFACNMMYRDGRSLVNGVFCKR